MLEHWREKLSGKILLRFLYIAVSLGGILYEFLKVQPVRWPLIAGYSFIIIAMIFAIRQRHDAEQSA